MVVNEIIEKIMEEIESVLDKQEDKKMEYEELGKVFKSCDKIEYFMAISRLRREKRMDRVTENGKLFYKLT